MADYAFIGGQNRRCQARGCSSNADYWFSRNWGGTDFCYAHAIEVLHADLEEARGRQKRLSGWNGAGWAVTIGTVNTGSDIECINRLLREVPLDYSRRTKEMKKALETAKGALERAL